MLNKYVLAIAIVLLAAAFVSSEGDTRQAFSLTADSVSSPSDHITIDDLHVFQDKAVIEKENLIWARVKDTHSMEPLLNIYAITLEVAPESAADIEVGDVISYEKDSIVIIHRVVELGNDGSWFAITKGDNNKEEDKEKVRFNQVKGVLVGVLY